LLSGLFGDPELAGLFSEQAELAAMLRFEAALSQGQAQAGLIPAQAADEIAALCADFVPDTESLRRGVARDGVLVPDLIKQMRAALPDQAASHLHFGATSQDVVDTGLVLRLVTVTDIVSARLGALIRSLETLETKFGGNRMMGRTRMQDALEITAADRL